MTVLYRELIINHAVLQCSLWVHKQQYTKNNIVGKLRMTGIISMDVMSSSFLAIFLAEVEAARCPRDFGIEALAPNFVTQSLHWSAEAIDSLCLTQDN